MGKKGSGSSKPFDWFISLTLMLSPLEDSLG